MSTLEAGQPDHWRSLSNPDLDALPTDEAVAIIAARSQDLFAGEVEPKDPDGHPTLQVTESDQGTSRMRAFVRDEDAGIGYFDHEYFAGMVAPDENGVLHVEQRHPYVRYEAVYRVDTINPDNSSAYAWRDGEAPAEIPMTRALGDVIHMLGTFARRMPLVTMQMAIPRLANPICLLTRICRTVKFRSNRLLHNSRSLFNSNNDT